MQFTFLAPILSSQKENTNPFEYKSIQNLIEIFDYSKYMQSRNSFEKNVIWVQIVFGWIQ